MKFNFTFGWIKFQYFAIGLALFSLLLDIGGGFGIKYTCLALVFFVAFVSVLKFGISQAFWLDGCVLLFFAASAIVSVIRNAPVEYALAEVSFVVFFVLLFIGKGVPPDSLIKLFLRVSLLGAIIIIFTFFIILSYPEIGRASTQFAKEYRLGYLGFRPGFEGFPNVYYRWSVWMLLGFSLALYAKKYLVSIIISIAAVMTFSSAIIGGIFLVAGLYGVFASQSNVSRLFRLIFLSSTSLLLFFSLLLIFPEIVEDVLLKFSAESRSTSVKLGHIESILEIFNLNPLFLFFGQGAGTSFYSVGVNDVVTNVEVSHFNLLRQFGLVGWLVFFGYVAFIILQLMKLGKGGQGWGIGLFTIFLVAGTNPLLLSPIFIVPLVLGRIFSTEFFRSNKYAETKNRSSFVYI